MYIFSKTDLDQPQCNALKLNNNFSLEKLSQRNQTPVTFRTQTLGLLRRNFTKINLEQYDCFTFLSCWTVQLDKKKTFFTSCQVSLEKTVCVCDPD